MTRARFLVVNVMLAAVGIAYWRLGLFAQVSLSIFSAIELAFIGTLLAYLVPGVVCTWRGKWEDVAHYAHGLPILALPMTGAGLVMAIVAAAQGVEPVTLMRVIVVALIPNIIGAAGYWYLREMAWQSARERV